MLGAIAGDIIGSVYEFHNIHTKDFPLFRADSRFTDDSVLTIALADAIMSGRSYQDLMREYYQRYPHAGYGGYFHSWATSPKPKPYNSWGNGAAMRISAVGFAFDNLEETMEKAKAYTAITHNHPEGIKGAQATAALARKGKTKDEVKQYIINTFGYDLSLRCDEIRLTYSFNESCQGTVPQAIRAFLESQDFEDAMRLAVSLGGGACLLWRSA